MMIWGIPYRQNWENMATIERRLEPAKRRTADPLGNGLMFIGAGFGLLRVIILPNRLVSKKFKKRSFISV